MALLDRPATASVHELILGGQRSGKSRCAEERARLWLDQPGHAALLMATAHDDDAEMHDRIARHRSDRALRVPALQTLELQTFEAPRHLPDAIAHHSAPARLIVVDCLTLWLTQLLMPMHGEPLSASAVDDEVDALCGALARAAGPVVLVSNEIGWGVMSMSAEVRRFVDDLGRLHQVVAARCGWVTLMVAGLEMAVKR